MAWSDFFQLLRKEKSYAIIIIMYSVSVSLVALAVPFSIQILINQLIIGSLFYPIFTAVLVTFGLLILSGVLYLVQVWLAEFLKRRILTNISAIMATRMLNSKPSIWRNVNSASVINRFFEIPVIQNTVAKLMISGSTLALQTLVGLVVLAIYHPLFIIFDLLLIGSLYFVWKNFSEKAVKSAYVESSSKYVIADWLEEIAKDTQDFRHISAKQRSYKNLDQKLIGYLRARDQHFRTVFTQSSLLVFVHGLLSALLLGIGGYLVFIEQLSLGQLVAAEIIVSGILWGLRTSGELLEGFYDLTASLRKLNFFIEVEQDEGSDPDSPEGAAILEVKDMRFHNSDINFKVPLNAHTVYYSADLELIHLLFDRIHQIKPQCSGYLLIEGQDIERLSSEYVLKRIQILEKPKLFRTSLRENFCFGGTLDSDQELIELIELMKLKTCIERLSGGLDEIVLDDNSNLLWPEVLKIHLLRAILYRPRAIVLGDVYQDLGGAFFNHLVENVMNRYQIQLICFFSNELPGLDKSKFIINNLIEKKSMESEL